MSARIRMRCATRFTVGFLNPVLLGSNDHAPQFRFRCNRAYSRNRAEIDPSEPSERRYAMIRKLVVTLAIIGALITGTATVARAVHGGMGMHGGHMGMGMRAGHVGATHRGFVHHSFAF